MRFDSATEASRTIHRNPLAGQHLRQAMPDAKRIEGCHLARLAYLSLHSKSKFLGGYQTRERRCAHFLREVFREDQLDNRCHRPRPYAGSPSETDRTVDRAAG